MIYAISSHVELLLILVSFVGLLTIFRFTFPVGVDNLLPPFNCVDELDLLSLLFFHIELILLETFLFGLFKVIPVLLRTTGVEVVFIEALLLERYFNCVTEDGMFEVLLGDEFLLSSDEFLEVDDKRVGGFNLDCLATGSTSTTGTFSFVGSSLTKVPCRMIGAGSICSALRAALFDAFGMTPNRLLFPFNLPFEMFDFGDMMFVDFISRHEFFVVTTLAIIGVFVTRTDLLFCGDILAVIRYGEM